MSHRPVIVHFVHWPVSGITMLLKSLLASQSMQTFDHYLLFCEGQEQHFVPFNGLIKGSYAISPTGSFVANVFAVPKILKTWKPDLIHSHSFQPSLWAALWRENNIPHLRTIHSPYPYLLSNSYSAIVKRTLERWALTRPNTQTVAVSPKAASRVQDSYGLKVNTFVNGIDHTSIMKMAAESPADSLAEELSVKRKGLRILVSCGRLHPEKGFDLLLQGFYQLTKSYGNLMLWLIGDGQQYSKLSMEIKRLGLEQRVILLGHQANPYWYLAQADIYVASSHYEGFPLAPVEALSLGLSVVAAPSTVEPLALNNEVAVCLPVLSVEAIASGVKQLLDDGSLVQRLEQAAPKFSQRYSIDVTAERYAQQYSAMLA